ELAFEIPEAYQPELVTLSATEDLTLGGNARVLSGVVVGSKGTASLAGGASVDTSLWADGDVSLGPSSAVSGVLAYAGTLTNLGGTVGTLWPVTDVPFETIEVTAALPATS